VTQPTPTGGKTFNTEFAAQLPERASPILDANALAELAPFGADRVVEVGDVLFRAGDESYDFVVVLEGAVDIIRPDVECETLITTHFAGRFLGELNMVTGQRAALTARVSQPGRVLAIPVTEFRRVMSTKPDLADMIFSAFVARRDILRTGEGKRAVRIIGSRYSREAMALRAFASRSRVPHEWIDTEGEGDVEVLLAGMGFRPRDTPVVITSA
jgi:thioredoxin reductase (NADPH)